MASNQELMTAGLEDQSNISQVKIPAWQNLMEDLDVTSDRIRPEIERHQVIVVATLLSKLPNIGGLCRTCEAFNAELLVVATPNIISDPQFISTCVSAEKWMPTQAVSESELPKFLEEKKEDAYTIVGVEQTNESKYLGRYQFPEKIVLVLGKEKEGIPPELLKMMDVVVEIPQFGVIRSLNVHVSGSILLWEYTKQLIESQSK
jgi:tRNA G18 (ribose-2'-O)-methylase SpoU